MPALNIIMQELLNQSTEVGEVMQITQKSERMVNEENNQRSIAKELNEKEYLRKKLKVFICYLKKPFINTFSTFYNANVRLDDALSGFKHHLKLNQQQAGETKFLKNLASCKKREDLSINYEIHILEAKIEEINQEIAKKTAKTKDSQHLALMSEIEDEENQISYKQKSEMKRTQYDSQESEMEKELKKLYQEDRKTVRMRNIIAEFGDSIENIYFAIYLEEGELKTINNEIRRLKKRLQSSEKRATKLDKKNFEMWSGGIKGRGLEYRRVLLSISMVKKVKSEYHLSAMKRPFKLLEKVEEDGVIDSFLAMIAQRADGVVFKTNCSAFNYEANKISQKQAAIFLAAYNRNMFMQQAIAA